MSHILKLVILLNYCDTQIRTKPAKLVLNLQDEIIKVTLPPHLVPPQSDERAASFVEDVLPETETSDQKVVDDVVATDAIMRDDDVEAAKVKTSGLIPPPNLFKNPKAHKLQIFVSLWHNVEIDKWTCMCMGEVRVGKS